MRILFSALILSAALSACQQEPALRGDSVGKVTQQDAGSVSADYGLEILRLTNEFRAKKHKCGDVEYDPAPPVTWNNKLATSAQNHAEDMAKFSYLSSTSLDGRTYTQRIEELGYYWSSAAENVARGQFTPGQVMYKWLYSTTSKACHSIMSPKFTELGVGYAKNSTDRGYYWVQDFGTPLPSVPALGF